jgi:hypothetical protein
MPLYSFCPTRHVLANLIIKSKGDGRSVQNEVKHEEEKGGDEWGSVAVFAR